jgi:hypothetical protein
VEKGKGGIFYVRGRKKIHRTGTVAKVHVSVIYLSMTFHRQLGASLLEIVVMLF